MFYTRYLFSASFHGKWQKPYCSLLLLRPVSFIVKQVGIGNTLFRESTPIIYIYPLKTYIHKHCHRTMSTSNDTDSILHLSMDMFLKTHHFLILRFIYKNETFFSILSSTWNANVMKILNWADLIISELLLFAQLIISNPIGMLQCWEISACSKLLQRKNPTHDFYMRCKFKYTNYMREKGARIINAERIYTCVKKRLG